MVLFQRRAWVRLRHISTDLIGKSSPCPELSHLPSGKLFLFSQATEPNTATLWSYDGVERTWEEVLPTPKVCVWSHQKYIQCLTISKNNYIAISCCVCQDIKLYNVETGETSTAFHDPKYYPSTMWLGEPGEMFVGNFSDTLQLNCSTVNFTLESCIQSPLLRGYSCFIPPRKCIASVSNGMLSLVQSAACESEKVIWQVNLKGEPFRRILYSPNHDALFIRNRSMTYSQNMYSQIHVVNADDGSLRQVLHLREKVRFIQNFSLHDDQLVVIDGGFDQCIKISHFSVK